jgi:O-antigen ligase
MNASRASLRSLMRALGGGRVVIGVVVVLSSILVFPAAVWLTALVAAMLTRPRNSAGRTSFPHPALAQWTAIGLLFTATAAFSMLRNPLTGHGIQLFVWFSLLPGIAVMFWFSARRAHTVTAVWVGTTVGASVAGLSAAIEVVLLDDQRAAGLVKNSITFGNLALVMGAVSLVLHRLVDLPRRAALGASIGAVTLGLFASILSGARGGWLIIPVLAVTLVWYMRSELTPFRVAAVAVGFVGVVSIASVLADGMPTTRASAGVVNVSVYAASEPTAESASSSEGARLEAWRSAGTAFREHPISGIGWGNLGERFARDVELGIRNERIATFEHAHNQLLGAAANGGLIGLAAVTALFLVPFRIFSRSMRSRQMRERTLGLCGVLVLGSFAVFGLTEAVLENLAPVTFLAVIMAALCAELDAGAALPAAGPVRHDSVAPVHRRS